MAADHPPNSRLFILCHPSLTAADMKVFFDKFGHIEDCWIVNDKNRKSKGISAIFYKVKMDFE